MGARVQVVRDRAETLAAAGPVADIITARAVAPLVKPPPPPRPGTAALAQPPHDATAEAVHLRDTPTTLPDSPGAPVDNG